MTASSFPAPTFPAPPRPTAEATFRVRPRVDAADVLPRVALPSLDPAELWARVHAEGTPLVDESGDGGVGDGGVVLTFVYRERDDTSTTAAVVLDRSQRVEASTCETSALEPLGDGVWALSLRVESQWRGAYALAASSTPAPQLDSPDADRLAWWWAAAEHAAADPHAGEQLDAKRSVAGAPAAPRSSINASHPTQQPAVEPATPLADHPGFSVLIPSTPAPAAGWPVVLLLDGDRWLDLGIGAITAELASAGTPFLTLLHEPTDRVTEYTCSQDWVSLAVAAISAVGRLWPVTGGAIVAGQSLGGLAAVHAQCAAPDVFAASISQSGSFWWSSHDPEADGARWLTRTIAEHQPHLRSVWLEAGLREHDQAEQSGELAAVLAALPTPPRLHWARFDGGHDWACWRAGLAEALAWALDESGVTQ